MVLSQHASKLSSVLCSDSQFTFSFDRSRVRCLPEFLFTLIENL